MGAHFYRALSLESGKTYLCVCHFRSALLEENSNSMQDTLVESERKRYLLALVFACH